MRRGIERFSLEVAFTADEHPERGLSFSAVPAQWRAISDQVLVGQWGPYDYCDEGG